MDSSKIKKDLRSLLTWAEARTLFAEKESEFTRIIDELKPSDQEKIYRFRYQYGDLVYSKGLFYLPDEENGLIAINDPSVPKALQDDLSYSSLPLAANTGHGVEIFNELDDRLFSMAYFNHGVNLGVWELFAPTIPLSVSAGARSLQILPRISESNSHRKLQRFGVTQPPPKWVFDQWHIFKQAAHHSDFYKPWECDLIFFGKGWIDRMRNDPDWSSLERYLQKKAWDHTTYIRNKMHLEMLWESFSRLLHHKKIKPQPYIVETLKHLVFIAIGALPGFRPATNEEAAPIDSLTRMYLEDYGLKTYYPSFMQPDYFDLKSEQSHNYIYYSLQTPTYLESIPKTRTPVSARADLIELIHLINQFKVELVENQNLRYSAHHFYKQLMDIQFDYFHDEVEPHVGIKSSSELAKDDPRFCYLPKNTPVLEERKFCERGTFARGCVRISKIKTPQ